ncbi:basic blue protein-like [Syzygium oleosum]|uniref:basic blue protein-like n=1 Tax=Syzygium oleosum TaxID=219896 RepID=UPI0024BB9D84|nr:basic blue protein-like [Syzygium oleosum]
MGRGVVLAGFLVVAMLACLGGAASTEYVVGDSRGWTTSNITVGYYGEWAANKTFRGGDSLKFVWNGMHNVAIVSREEYDNCTKVTSYFYGGEAFMYTLPDNASGSYYFISTFDADCENGLKLAINVVSLSPTESPNSSASPITAGALSVLVLVSSSIIAMFMN